jgi:peptide/nickel transport system ATP-binding protein
MTEVHEAPLLDVRDLTVEFATRRGTVTAVSRVDISVGRGETLGIVGESGSGKSVTSYAVMRILDRAGRIASGSIMFGGADLCATSEAAMRGLRGRAISMIFQNPRAALNPIRRVGRQIEDVLLNHGDGGFGASRAAARGEAIEALRRVRIADPALRYHAYPFELSGGMCQRVVIALALACRPLLLIADEPTTGLDVTTQKAVMDLVVELTRERGMSTILITHDLGLAAAYCDRVMVMEQGKVVETAPSRQIFATPAHPYTRKLMKATPRPGAGLRDLLADGDGSSPPLGASSPPSGGEGRAEGGVRQGQSRSSGRAFITHTRESEESDRGAQTRGAPPSSHPSPAEEGGEGARCGDWRVPSSQDGRERDPLLTVENLVKEFPRNAVTGALARLLGRKDVEKPLRAVGGISLTIAPGESVGLVGESGCGKSTTSMMVMRLLDQTSGTIRFDGEDIGAVPARLFANHGARKRIQMVFQDPTDSLNPRFTAARAIADPLMRLGGFRNGPALRASCEALAAEVGLPVPLLDRFPHQLSGGQKARVGIARAIALRPRLLVLDEPTAALDVSVQAVVLNLLADLKTSLGMSYLFVSHDLNVVRLLCDRVIVMRAGEIVEQGATEEVLAEPKAAYTRDLLAAIPRPPV